MAYVCVEARKEKRTTRKPKGGVEQERENKEDKRSCERDQKLEGKEILEMVKEKRRQVLKNGIEKRKMVKKKAEK